MFAWFTANLGTLAVLLVLVAVIAAIVRTLHRDRGMGKNSCGAKCGKGCAGCSGCGGCHS